MVVGAIPAGEKPGRGLEEVLGKVLTRGIEVWWPEEGDRRKGATVGPADERSLLDVRRKEDMTVGFHKEVKYLGGIWADRPPLQSGPSGGRVLHSVQTFRSQRQLLPCACSS